MTTPGAKSLVSKGKATMRPKYGIMNLFGYDPKHKATLPYYDKFPLIMPLESAKGVDSMELIFTIYLMVLEWHF